MTDDGNRVCGSCTICCKVPAIPEFDKPCHRWCTHCEPGRGCSIYAERPQRCRDFLCLWMQWPALDDKLRPDRSGVLLMPRPHPLHGRIVMAMVAKGDHARAQRRHMVEILKGIQADGFKVFVNDGTTTKQLMRDGSLVPAAAL